MKQHLYTPENIEKNFWSCYTNVFFEENSLTIAHTLNGYQVTLIADQATRKALNDALEEGTDDETLKQLLSPVGGQPVLDELYFKGMIE